MLRLTTAVVAILAVLAALPTVESTTNLGKAIRERVAVARTIVTKYKNGTIVFPAKDGLPPFLIGLKIVPTDRSRRKYDASSPYLNEIGSATIISSGGESFRKKSKKLSIIFSTPSIRAQLSVRTTSRKTMAVSGSVSHSFQRPFGMRLHQSRRSSVADGVAAIEKALAANPEGPRLQTVVDHADNAAAVGFSLPDSSVVVFGNPAIGSKLWTRRPAIGSDIPLEILVAASPLGPVYVGWNSASLMRNRYALAKLEPSVDAVLNTIDGVLARLAGLAADRELTASTLDFDAGRIPKDNGLNITRAKGDAEEAFGRLEDALEAAPPVGIAYRVPHDIAATTAGLETDGKFNRVVVFGNPALGTRIMQGAFTAALDLPVKMNVWTRREGASRFLVGYTAPEWIGLRHGVDVPAMLSMAMANFAADAVAAA